jgi:hypothetical protein
MSLDRGVKATLEQFHKNHWKNLHRLYIWLMIGADIENGLWAIYGARQGLVKTMLSDWDYVNVRDFDWLNDFWNSNVKDTNINNEIVTLGREIVNDLNLPISSVPLGHSQSKFFKTVYQNPARIPNKQFMNN